MLKTGRGAIFDNPVQESLLNARPESQMEGARVIVEKPFGRDLASARRLNEVAHTVLPGGSVFRIDRLLGKDALMNILDFHFANSFQEPIRNRNCESSVAPLRGGMSTAGENPIHRLGAGGRVDNLETVVDEVYVSMRPLVFASVPPILIANRASAIGLGR